MADTQCDVCGQTDSDPKAHYCGPWAKDERTTVSDPSWHFDCIPADIRETLIGPGNANAVATIDAAESGTKGADLLAFIQSLPNDNVTEES